MGTLLTEAQIKVLTEGDFKKIRQELWDISNVHKPVVLKALNEARAQGDLSENADYSASKAAEDEVGMNNTVKVHSEKTGRDMTLKIVTWIRVSPLERKVSVASPMGSALYKHKVGDRVPVTLDSGETFYATILEIDKSTDESDDAINSY